MGTSTRPMLLTSPDRAKTLVPLLDSVPTEAYQSPPLSMIWGTLARVSTLFKMVGFSHNPLWAGNGGRGPGHAAAALDGAHQGGLLAADKGAGPLVDVHLKGKSRIEDVFPQQPVCLGLVDGDLQPPNGQGILGAGVDIALMGVDGPRGDDHPFDDRMGIGLENGAVHEGAGVALRRRCTART